MDNLIWNIIEKISERPFSSVFRVKHKNTGEIAALKIINQNLFNDIDKRRFKRSYISTSKISHVNCVKMIELIETETMAGYVMEYIEGKNLSSIKKITMGDDLFSVIPLIIQICNGLNALHRNNLIHRDLKPSNILISKDNIIKITDFDFIKSIDSLEATIEGTYLGTIKYSSPEQCINASKIDLRSDLYSLGIIIYELITGEVPFRGISYTEIALAHLKSSVISPKKFIVDLPTEVEEIVLKLLEKNPEKRYNSTKELIKALKKIPAKEKIDIKFDETKKYILPTIFTGRKEELKILKKCYKETTENKEKIVFIQGESGIGKTRLLEEFKFFLELEQIPIIDIQCKENKLIYAPLKDLILKIIDLFKNISTVELIKVMGKFSWDLVEIVPELKDLEVLKKIEKLQPLSNSESEIRLFRSITNLIKNYFIYLTKSNISHKGIVILFDDFQLVEEPVVRWLSYATRNLSKNNVLFVSTYRDESKYLKNTINKIRQDCSTEIISLKPFSKNEISEMLVSIFVTNIDPIIIEEIEKITKGNPFYIRELLQYLINNNKLKIEKNYLKLNIEDIYQFKSKTVEVAINNHLNHLSPNSREILLAASIIGETFNINLLKHIFNYEETVILNSLEESRTLNLIDYDENIDIYKFYHSLIWKTLLDRIEKEKKKKYHLIIAKKLEKDLDDKKFLSNREEIIEKLADHYFSADISQKALIYCAKAGDMAKNRYSNEKAISLYNKVLKLSGDNNNFEIEYLTKQGEIYKHLGEFDKAEEIFNRALILAKTKNKKINIAKLNSLIGEQLRLKGKFKEAIEYFKKDLKISKEIGDNNGISRVFNNIGKVNSNLGKYNIALDYFNKKLQLIKKQNNKKDIAETLLNIAGIFFLMEEFNKAYQYYKESLSIAEKMDEKLLISRNLCNIAMIYGRQKKYNKALEYYEKSLIISRNIGYKRGIATVIGNMGIIYKKLKEYKKAMVCYKTSLNINEELDDKQGISLNIGNIGFLFETQGYFDRALEYFERDLQLNEKIDDKYEISIALDNIGGINEYKGNYIKALEYYEKSINICESNSYKSEIINIYRKAARSLISIKNYNRALEYFDKSIKIAKELKLKNLIFINILDKVELLIEINNYKDAKSLIEENNFENDKDIFRAKVLSLRVDCFLENNGIAISKLLKMLKSNTEEIKKAYLNYTLWKIESYKDKVENDKFLKEALNIYKKLYKAEFDLFYKQKIYELEEDLKNIIKDNRIENDENLKLINSLVKFLNHETAFNELLKFLTLNIDADTALLLVRKENKIKNKMDIDNFEIKAFSSDLKTEDMDFSMSILKKVILNKNPALISNAVEDSNLKNNISIIGKPFLSVISVPLTDYENKIIGALYLDRRNIEKKSFNDSDLLSVKKIARILMPILLELKKNENMRISAEIQKMGLFIGISKKMNELYENIEKASEVDMILLIQGETGTGKELVAKALHKLSIRRNNPFIAINCSAIPRDLAESELFGHEKGSFSGAVSIQLGKFQLAEKGILFLDEIAELPYELQAKLLRALQNNEIWRIGGQKPIPINVRVVASTHRNLIDEVKKGNFREDLFHRLNVLKIDVPPLRERKEDIPLLAYHFLKLLSDKYNKKVYGFTDLAIYKLQSYEWLGNVRELENLIAKIFIKHSGDSPINEEELLFKCALPDIQIQHDYSFSESSSFIEQIDDFKKKLLERYLRKNNWNISKTAEELKTNRAILYRIIKKNKIKINNKY